VCADYGATDYCLESCSFGPEVPLGGAFDPAKCHGRKQLACSPFFDKPALGACTSGNCPVGQACGDDGQCHALTPACAPLCSHDSDCETGMYCNSKTGLCSAQAAVGKNLGETCTLPVDGGTEECKGHCTEFSDAPGPFCTEPCVMGADAQCGWAGDTSGTPAPGICIFGYGVVADNGGPGNGDLGFCAPLCDCNAQCAVSGWICQAWGGAGWATYTMRAGFCTAPQNLVDGGLDPGIPACP
jgi:hypothetical protein